MSSKTKNIIGWRLVILDPCGFLGPMIYEGGWFMLEAIAFVFLILGGFTLGLELISKK